MVDFRRLGHIYFYVYVIIITYTYVVTEFHDIGKWNVDIRSYIPNETKVLHKHY